MVSIKLRRGLRISSPEKVGSGVVIDLGIMIIRLGRYLPQPDYPKRAGLARVPAGDAMAVWPGGNK